MGWETDQNGFPYYIADEGNGSATIVTPVSEAPVTFQPVGEPYTPSAPAPTSQAVLDYIYGSGPMPGAPIIATPPIVVVGPISPPAGPAPLPAGFANPIGYTFPGTTLSTPGNVNATIITQPGQPYPSLAGQSGIPGATQIGTVLDSPNLSINNNPFSGQPIPPINAGGVADPNSGGAGGSNGWVDVVNQGADVATTIGGAIGPTIGNIGQIVGKVADKLNPFDDLLNFGKTFLLLMLLSQASRNQED